MDEVLRQSGRQSREKQANTAGSAIYRQGGSQRGEAAKDEEEGLKEKEKEKVEEEVQQIRWESLMGLSEKRWRTGAVVLGQEEILALH